MRPQSALKLSMFISSIDMVMSESGTEQIMYVLLCFLENHFDLKGDLHVGFFFRNLLYDKAFFIAVNGEGIFNCCQKIEATCVQHGNMTVQVSFEALVFL